MKEAITQKLIDIETQNDVRVLFAIESGSRGWGFHSPDSDYDVRFVYVHPRDWYLGIEDRKDFMNVEVNEVFDVVGYDVRRALQFFNTTNSKIYEWLQSPIFYRKDEIFIDDLQALMPSYYALRKGMHHYLGLTRNTLNNDLQTEEVKLKKYFYALRPVLAAQWIMKYNSCPPMVFDKLRALINNKEIEEKVSQLLVIKQTANEKFLIPRDEVLNKFITDTLATCEAHAQTLGRIETDTKALNKLFMQTIGL